MEQLKIIGLSHVEGYNVYVRCLCSCGQTCIRSASSFNKRKGRNYKHLCDECNYNNLLGEKNYRCKLTNVQVDEIRNLWDEELKNRLSPRIKHLYHQKDIADMYGVTIAHISAIVNYKEKSRKIVHA